MQSVFTNYCIFLKISNLVKQKMEIKDVRDASYRNKQFGKRTSYSSW